MNEALHQELTQLYQALAQQHLAHLKNPVILVDWSDLTSDGRWQLLHASIALEGRSVTLYEQVHPQRNSGALRVHRQFLARLSSMLPFGCVPILANDAGFRAAWFKLVNQHCWHWIGRIRNRDMVRRVGGRTWSGCKTLYLGATETPCSLGPNYRRANLSQFEYVRSRNSLQDIDSKEVRTAREICSSIIRHALQEVGRAPRTDSEKIIHAKYDDVRG